MSQVSPLELDDLFKKFFDENTPVSVLLKLDSGSTSQLRGFVDGFTRDTGLLIGTSRPATGAAARVMIRFFSEDVLRPCKITYGERRELPPELQDLPTSVSGMESVLSVRFLDTGEFLALFFNV
jgi:hypothetical protein